MTRLHGKASPAAADWQVAWHMVPTGIRTRIKRFAGLVGPPVGQVSMGDFAGVQPVSRHFGHDRGTPIDRWYIERFLAAHAIDIRGRALEVGDDAYCRRFGTAVTRQDVLHVDPDAAQATIVGDMNGPDVLPEGDFDCLVNTQTLHLIADYRAAVEQMHRALAPGGTLLLTVPGVSSVDRGEWGEDWLWSFTARALRLIIEPTFGAENAEVVAHGNVYAATCFLQGLSVQEVDEEKLAYEDPAYPLIVTVRATRAD